MRSISLRAAVVFALVSVSVLVGCAGDEEGEEPVAKTEEELRQGGCSMSEIRGWQAACRSNFGSGVRGIHYCYPGMSMRHMGCDGACAC